MCCLFSSPLPLSQQPSAQPVTGQHSAGPPQKEFNIDALRSIVESSPLAKPNPFDPPSPPLSAFLPPPEVQPGATLLPGTVTQYGATGIHNDEASAAAAAMASAQGQAPVAQALIQHQPPVPVADYTRLQPAGPNEQGGRVPEGSAQVIQYQQMGAGVNFERTHAMPSAQPLVQPVMVQGSPYPQDGQPEQIQPAIQTEPVEDDEDEGAAYATVPMDESGKRLPPGYSQPVDFAELEKSNAAADAQQFQSQRLPQNLMENSQQAQNAQNQIVYGTIPTSENQFNNQPNNGIYEEGPQNMGNTNQEPASIEYGGFVPIKRPGQQQPQQDNFGPMQHNQQAPYDMVTAGAPHPHDSVQVNGVNLMQAMQPQLQHAPQQVQQQQVQVQRPHYQAQQPQQGPGPQKPVFRPYFGKDAIRKLNEMGISEDDFYKTVQKVMKSNYVKNIMSNNGLTGKPMHPPKNFMFPKANFYRRPNKNRGNGQQGGQRGPKAPMANFEDINISK